ncbi:MAG: hypothetical protein ABSF26_19700 [Thermoguttaceae bacterium]|jgi:hypothetical protein
MTSFTTKGNQGAVAWESGSIWVGGVAPTFDGDGNNSDDITIAAGDVVSFGTIHGGGYVSLLGNLDVAGILTQSAGHVHVSVTLNDSGSASQTTIETTGCLALFPVGAAEVDCNCQCNGNVLVKGIWDLGNGVTQISSGVTIALAGGCTLIDGWELVPADASVIVSLSNSRGYPVIFNPASPPVSITLKNTHYQTSVSIPGATIEILSQTDLPDISATHTVGVRQLFASDLTTSPPGQMVDPPVIPLVIVFRNGTPDVNTPITLTWISSPGQYTFDFPCNSPWVPGDSGDVWCFWQPYSSTLSSFVAYAREYYFRVDRYTDEVYQQIGAGGAGLTALGDPRLANLPAHQPAVDPSGNVRAVDDAGNHLATAAALAGVATSAGSAATAAAEAKTSADSAAASAAGAETAAGTAAGAVAALPAAVWSNPQRTLTGGPAAGAPAVAQADADIYSTVFRGGTRPLAAHVSYRGRDIQQADVQTIAYSVYLLDDQDPDCRAPVPGFSALPLAAAEVIFDALQTDQDAAAYNFRHTPDVSRQSAFPVAGCRYLVEYRLTPAAGQIVLVRFRINVI